VSKTETVSVRRATRRLGDRWCTVHVALHDRGGKLELSITGQEGRILPRAEAERTALDYWIQFFEDQPDEITAMNQRSGSRCATAKAAARYVIKTDGKLHGLDVARDEMASEAQDGEVWILDSCGQIGGAINEWFPEVSRYRCYHLNSLKSTCEHQEARGETFRAWAEAEPTYVAPSPVADLGHVRSAAERATRLAEERSRIVTARRNHKAALDAHAQRAVCPECGYRLGSSWLHRELPAEVIAWARSFGEES